MPRIARKFSKWKVTIDGVEVPWQNISLRVGVDFPGQLEVSMEPDPVLRHLRSGSKVHLWMYDPDAEGDEDLDKLFMYWAGDLRSSQYQKSHGARSQIIVAEGELAIFGRSKMYAHGFGTLTNTHLVSGSVLVAPDIWPKQLVSYTILGKVFDPNVKNVKKKKGDKLRDPEEPNYSERMLRFMAYLSSYNALFRLQAVRSNIFGKIASFGDESLTRMLPRALVSDFYTQARTSVKPESTILDLIHLLNGMSFYHYASIAGPVVPSTGKGSVSPEEVSYIGFPGVEPDDHLYSMPRRFLRNDYIFMPETFYAIPPSCNLIFPEFLNEFSLARDFMTEPTRALITNTHLNAPLSVVAPDDILRFEAKPDPAQFWSLNKDGIKHEGSVESPYESRTVKGSPAYNLFGAVSDAEVEKGIIAVTDYPSYEFFSAVSNTFDLTSAEGKAHLEGMLDEKSKMTADVLEGKSPRDRAFLYMMKAIADYTFLLEKFRRRVSVSLVGHRWVVPGFPSVIMDTVTSYIAYVRTFSLNLSPNGDETGGADLDFVRPFPSIDRKIIKKAEKAIEAMAVIESEIKKLNDKMDTLLLEAKIAESGYLSKSNILNPRKRDRYFARIKTLYRTAYMAIREDDKKLARLGYTRSQLNNLSIELTTHRPSVLVTYQASTKTMINKAREVIEFYVNAVKSDAAVAAKTFDAKKVPTVFYSGDPTKTLKNAISSASLGDDFPEDFMVPPVFGNLDLLSVQGSEKIYNDLFGAKKVFSAEGGFPESGLPFKKATTARVLALKKQSYTKFVNFAQALNRVFPILGTDASENEGEVGTSEWEERSSKKDSDESLRDWAETKYLKRERLQSLSKFLKVNGLKLEKPFSDPPTQQKFLHFVPAETFELPSKAGYLLTWDNTLFSKIVDEFKMAKKTVKLRVPVSGFGVIAGISSAETVIDVPMGPDKRILELRKSVKNPFLTTEARQAIILDYARRHHGSRGFGGS